MDKVAAIKKLYYGATRATIQRDLVQAVSILKSMSSDEERERAAVFMDGLAQMRGQWAPHGAHAPAGPAPGARRRGPAIPKPDS